jgi:ABC-2 type transport system ATP-binding protein
LPESAISVEKLTRDFNGFRAVDQISFEVAAGEIFGLLGPNGAGKTTTINMLSTLLKPTSGQARVAGFDVLARKDDVRRSIGVVFQEPALDTKLTGKENLEFHAMMYGIDKPHRRRRIGEVLELVELTDKADSLVETYSGGMKRRLEISRGLIHRPDVLFLDEPTLGLDAQTRRRIWEYIIRLNRDSRVTIILTTHYMEEADTLCGRVAIMDKGRFAAMDAPERLKEILGGDVVSIELDRESGPLSERFEKLEWIKTVKSCGAELHLTMEKGERRIPAIIAAAQAAGAEVIRVNLHKPSLEDVFLHFTGRRIREETASRSERNRAMMRGHMRRKR